MKKHEKYFVFYIDNGYRRLYATNVNGKILWQPFMHEAIRFNQYQIGLKKAKKASKKKKNYTLGYVKIENNYEYRKVL